MLFTTHSVQDLACCDRVVFLAREGHLAFVGPVDEALEYFAVERIEEIYQRLASASTPEEWAKRFEDHRGDGAGAATAIEPGTPHGRDGIGFAREWAVLTRRTLETLVRNRLTMAILVGSPALVVAMFAVLFRPGAFEFASPNPSAITMILFWVTFGAFFFGLTYGLLQIVTEQAILRREQLVGQRLSAYLLSKMAVLLPFLVFVVVLMLAVLRALDRLPAASTDDLPDDGHHARSARGRRADARADDVRRRQQPSAGDARSADALLSGRAVLRGDSAGARDGRRGRGDQHDHSRPLGLRGARA